MDVSYSNVLVSVKAECSIEKFTKYIFADKIQSKGKNEIFYKLGFSLEDANYLKIEYCKQALNGYLKGKYKLKNLDRRGQRLAIPITLRGLTFYSGWMLYPEGKIVNITPYGGRIE